MSVSVVLAIAGCLALLFGVVGGGIKAREIELPILSGTSRIVSAGIGAILLGLSLWQGAKPNAAAIPTPPPQATGLPSAASPATLTPAVAPPASATSESATEPTVAPVITPVQALTQAAAGKAATKLYDAKTWTLVLSDEFDDNSSQWPMWNVDDDQKTETTEIADGVFNWGLMLKTPNHMYVEAAPVPSTYSDFLFSVRMRRVGGDRTRNQATLGIYFRGHGSDYYAFMTNDLLQYYIGYWKTGKWTDLVGWTRTPLAEQDKFNTFTVVADGPDLYFYINGVPIEALNDSAYSNGSLGLMAGLDIVETEFTAFQFDEFELRQKP